MLTSELARENVLGSFGMRTASPLEESRAANNQSEPSRLSIQSMNSSTPSEVEERDTLESFPVGYGVCVTNPPWLAKNIATFRDLPCPQTKFNNLYKYCLQKCLGNFDWVAAIVPESFLIARIFCDRLLHCVSLRNKLFNETGHPSCLALFGPDLVHDSMVWVGHDRVGYLKKLHEQRPEPRADGCKVEFNVESGNLGLYALDGTNGPSIRFCDVKELADYQVKKSGRHITKLEVESVPKIKQFNGYIDEFRTKTGDVLMTCYKGISKDGMNRRRLDWKLARGIIHHCSSALRGSLSTSHGVDCKIRAVDSTTSEVVA